MEINIQEELDKIKKSQDTLSKMTDKEIEKVVDLVTSMEKSDQFFFIGELLDFFEEDKIKDKKTRRFFENGFIKNILKEMAEDMS